MQETVELDIPAQVADLDDFSLELMGASDDLRFSKILERIAPTYSRVERLKVTAFSSKIKG
ncbi:hypothetical protein [Streptacidiphilus alkalitolerans]